MLKLHRADVDLLNPTTCQVLDLPGHDAQRVRHVDTRLQWRIQPLWQARLGKAAVSNL